MERAGQDTDEVRQVAPWPQVVEAGPFTRRLPADRAFDPGELGAGHRHAGGADPAYRRLQGRPDALGRRAVRPAGVPGARRAGVKVLACNSTNVFNAHAGRSEATLIEPIGALMRAAEGMVVATTFASNVARLKTLAEAARDAGRQVVVLGRAMNTMLKTAHAAEVLDGFPPVLDPLDTENVPRRSLMVLATGSQGERRAASAQLAQGKYMGLELKAGDTFLFSSKTIPGNEVASRGS